MPDAAVHSIRDPGVTWPGESFFPFVVKGLCNTAGIVFFIIPQNSRGAEMKSSALSIKGIGVILFVALILASGGTAGLFIILGLEFFSGRNRRPHGP